MIPGARSIAAVLIPLAVSSPTHSNIIIRHDRDDAKYVARAAEYASIVVDINIPRRAHPELVGGNGIGVLISPTWVLTAAHVAKSIRASGGTPQHSVMINGRKYVVTEVIVHPDWKEEGPHDIALLRLGSPASAHMYALPYTGVDEAGKNIVVVGTGDTGSGQTGPVAGRPTLRAATNVVDEVTSNELIFDFDSPDTPGVTELEGISGPGDSGGPALMSIAGKLFVAGVSVAGDGHGHGPGRYGSTEYYTRVSSHRAWIEATMRSDKKGR